MGVGDIASYLGPFLVRTFDWGSGQAARDRQLAEGSPLLAVLGTLDDTPSAWLQAGQALARMLLRATAVGLSASYLNQPIEVQSLRQQLGSLVHAEGFPQLLLRIGIRPARSSDTPPASRGRNDRPIDLRHATDSTGGRSGVRRSIVQRVELSGEWIGQIRRWAECFTTSNERGAFCAVHIDRIASVIWP